ncbi:MAG: MinD/ParA family protein [Spartobacteria bacterium]|nr:MinD/ParA family protein [Spartobacteria bacterium]
MSKIISIHSFRGGTGKSNTTANLSALLALDGKRVGVVDTDIQSPGIHVLFGVHESDFSFMLNDFLWGQCEIEQTAHDVTSALGDSVSGRVFLIPSSAHAADIARVINDGYDMTLLSEGFKRLIDSLALDVLLIDTHPGLNEETLLSLAISNALVVVLRPDYQDYEGTGITVEVARELDVPTIQLLVNKTPASFDSNEVKKRVEEAYRLPVGAVIPHCDELMALASHEIFVVRYPDHAVTAHYRQLLACL